MASWISARRRDVPAIRWVSPETLHITLKFYGEIQLDMIEALKKHLAALRHKGAFEMSVEGINGFPTLAVPNTVWTGIKTDAARLGEVFEGTERASLKIGVNKEKRPLRPHITLGRGNRLEPLDEKTLNILQRNIPRTEPWSVGAITLMRSELFAEGPKYTPLGRFKI